MSKHEIFMALDDIHYKYQRLESMIGIIQLFVANVVEIAGAPANCLDNALFELDSQLYDNNKKLEEILMKENGAA